MKAALFTYRTIYRVNVETPASIQSSGFHIVVGTLRFK